MLKSLCDFSNWKGSSAKWLDSCELSEDVTVSIYSISPLPNGDTNYFYGQSTFNAANGCYKIIPGMLPINSYAMELLFGLIKDNGVQE